MSKRQSQYLLASLLMISSLYANDSENNVAAPVPEEHVVVGSRPMSDSESALLEETRAQELAQNESNQAESLLENCYGMISFVNTPIDPNNPSYVVPVTYHWINKLSALDDFIEFEDNSNWRIDSSYANVVHSWRSGDIIAVTPNYYGLYSRCSYFLTNKNNKTYVAADLKLGPAPFGKYSHWVIGIDDINGNVYLDNGTSWKVDPRDRNLTPRWQINDHVIVGLNDEWLSTSDAILINVNKNNFVRTRQF